jgi:beta-N-acetylhexosaminidase
MRGLPVGEAAGSMMLRRAGAAVLAAGCALAGCRGAHVQVTAPTTVKPPSAPRPPTATTVAPGPSGGCSNQTVVDNWPLARRAAQLVVVPALNAQMNGLTASFAAGAGGVLILGQTVPGDLAQQVEAAKRSEPPGVPLAVMADEEGGGVQRLANLVGSLPWPRQMAATMTADQVVAAARRTGLRMRAAGVNVDLAPVVDVDGGPGPNSRDPDGQRSFSAVPATAARYGVAFADGLRQGGVIPVVKHFPGLGGASANTDNGLAATLPLSVLRTQGLLPFQAAIAAGVPAVLVSNATVPGLTTKPASLSQAVIQGLLRGTLGFHGLVLTDSLSAGAVKAAGYDVPSGAAAAVTAGADMILFGSTLTPADIASLGPREVNSSTSAIINALVGAVGSGALPVARLDAAVLDVLTAKGVNLCAASPAGGST